MLLIHKKRAAYLEKRRAAKDERLEIMVKKRSDAKIEEFRARQSTLMRQRQQDLQQSKKGTDSPHESSKLIDPPKDYSNEYAFDPAIALSKVSDHIFKCRNNGDPIDDQFILCLAQNKQEAVALE